MRAAGQFAVSGVTSVAWLVSVANAIPAIDPAISPAQGTLSAGVAVAGTIGLVVLYVQRPVGDVWEAGRIHGRREAIREASGIDTVASLATGRRRRRLREMRRREELGQSSRAGDLARQGTGEW